MAPGFLALGLTTSRSIKPPLTETPKLPSLLAHDIQTALKQFLVSAFEPTDAFSHGLMSRFVDDEMHRAKGLGFDCVIVVAPKSYLGVPEETETQRKLLYIALTRAKRGVMLTMG